MRHRLVSFLPKNPDLLHKRRPIMSSPLLSLPPLHVPLTCRAHLYKLAGMRKIWRVRLNFHGHWRRAIHEIHISRSRETRRLYPRYFPPWDTCKYANGRYVNEACSRSQLSFTTVDVGKKICRLISGRAGSSLFNRRVIAGARVLSRFSSEPTKSRGSRRREIIVEKWAAADHRNRI